MADPKKYRDEAERLRKEAATVDAEARQTMLDIAKLYERLADTLTGQRRDPKSGLVCLRHNTAVVRKSLLRGGWIGDEPPYPVPHIRTGDPLFNAIWQVAMAAGARVPPQSIREAISVLRTEIQKAAPDAAAEIARLKAADAVWRDNLRALWSALRMIREAVEQLGPAGAVPSEESILPEPHHEAEAIIKGIQAIAGRHVRTALSIDPETGQEIVTVESPAEVASWFFPDEEDERREALRKAIEELIEKR